MVPPPILAFAARTLGTDWGAFPLKRLAFVLSRGRAVRSRGRDESRCGNQGVRVTTRTLNRWTGVRNVCWGSVFRGCGRIASFAIEVQGS